MVFNIIFRNLPLYLLICCLLSACAAKPGEEKENETLLQSPDGRIRLALELDAQQSARYRIYYQDSLLLRPSKLGLLADKADFSRGLELIAVSEQTVVDEQYKMLHGKRSLCTYQAHEKSFTFSNAAGQKMAVVFRLSNDGLAFRYRLPEPISGLQEIKEELTSFAFPENTKAWLQPMSEAKSGWESTNPSYEEHYQMGIPAGQAAPGPAGWAYPALFNHQNAWVLISEADLDRNYCGTRLKQHSPGNEYFVGFPQPAEVMPQGKLLPQINSHNQQTLLSQTGKQAAAAQAWQSPWRIVTIGSLATLVESTLGTDLAAPAIDEDFSFVKPGLASWSWAILKDNSVNYAVQKEFIDYAADMGWPYTLVDADWDTRIGYEKTAELARYAAGKGVGLLLWYNSAGSWNSTPYHPKDKLLSHESRLAEFKKLKAMGISGIKVDFFGGDGQSVIAYYHDIFQDAAKAGLVVNCHGATLPRGWHRTYPNLLTIEAIKGFEFISFEQANADLAPSHCAMLPFARNAFDPMDFTPMALHEIPNIKRKTSAGFELALPYLFLSGIQHIAETPAGLQHVPGYVKDFLKDIPVAWDETRFIDGYPGKLVIIARRKGDHWYVAGINGEAVAKDVTLDLGFIGEGKKGLMIGDGNAFNSFTRQDILINTALAVQLKENGGFVMKF